MIITYLSFLFSISLLLGYIMYYQHGIRVARQEFGIAIPRVLEILLTENIIFSLILLTIVIYNLMSEALLF